MAVKVCKFGGTSMADGNIMLTAAKIVTSDEQRRYVVVSAPGKRFSGDIKVTDLLYRCAQAVSDKDGAAFEEVFGKISARFLTIETETGKNFGMREMLAKIKLDIQNGAGEEYCVSRGEYLAANVMAGILGIPFVDATEFIRFDENGALSDETFTLGAELLKKYPKAVIPGFYGLGLDGKIKTFSRGGGDISGAIVARCAKASLYENWTDVSGFYACDPRIINSPKWISQLSYRELRELSYMGANVLHSEAIFPVRTAGIPIRICNTFKPEDEGTYILPGVVAPDADQPVTGIAGKTSFTVINVEKSMMNSEVGFTMRLLSVLDKHKISFEHLPSGIDTMCLVIENSHLKEGIVDVLVKEIKEAVQPDVVNVLEDIALIATVGHGMARNVGIAARLFKALSEAGINVRMIDQGSSELNIIVGVEKSQYSACINAIYHEFFN
ncbi:MAG: aspartate kinase [Clostridia bacterium]|nr:aspartate kinase [Clostridia bacterium]